jgi:hypothetical protein
MEHYIHTPHMHQPSAINIFKGVSWAVAGAGPIGALGGGTYGTFLFPLYGTIAGAIIGSVIGMAAALVIGPAMAAAALLAPTPMARIKRATMVGAISSLLLSAVVAVALYVSHSPVVFVAMTLLPTTVGAAWTGAYVARSTLDSSTAAQLKNIGVRTWHVMAVSAINAALTWLLGYALHIIQ